MTIEQQAASLALRAEHELCENILPFWIRQVVNPDGGFFWALSNDLQVDPRAERSQVLCARLLWTYAAAYRMYHGSAALAVANRALDVLMAEFYDRQFGGMFWRLDPSGKPSNPRKQTYGQAFAIYALAEYFQATGDQNALEQARELYDLIEQHAFDPEYGGYIEGCDRSWGPLADMRLSEKEINCPKSMNTLLHIVEAYTNLLRAWPDQDLRHRLSQMVEVFLHYVIDPRSGRNRLFFERNWSSLSDTVSFGHDIECSWLLVEAAETIGDPDLLTRVQQTALRMAETVLARGLDSDGSIFYEGDSRGITSDQKHWWVQAEGVVGFWNAAFMAAPASSSKQAFLTAAQRLWDFIDCRLVDRANGEWFKVLDRSGRPMPGQVKAGPWEDPYHQARACMEIIQRAPRLP